MSATIFLLGDGIVDNFNWLEDKSRDLRTDLTSKGFTVHNFAVDNTRVPDITKGVSPDRSLCNMRSYNYPLDIDGKLYPLRLLTNTINTNKAFQPAYNRVLPAEEETNMVVLSVGGNDLNDKTSRMILGFETFIRSVLTEQFKAEYDKVLQMVRSSCCKIVLVSCYLPYMGRGSKYDTWQGSATKMVERWNEFIHSLGEKYNIPVLDLNRTFDIYDRSHYGLTEIRASNKSSKCIADCLAYIYKHYRGYHAYYAPSCGSRIVRE